MMRSIATIARRELRSLLDHPTGYILLVVFLVVTDFLFFRQAYLMGLASLRPMLQLLPWILLFFVPAVTMRALAEDIRSGTLEVVLAQPVSEAELLGGKYLGQVLFIWLAIALTIPVMVGLGLGADLQVGVLIAQYVGTALLTLGLAAVGVWASSVTPNQITAFILGVAVMFLLILVGIDPIIAGLPVLISNALASLSVLRHFENITRGVIDLRDAVYFVALAGVFLSLAYLALMRRKLSRRRETGRRLALGTTLLVALMVVVNLFGRQIGGRLDLTPGNAYTLSRASKTILGGLDDLVTITLFVSDELPNEFAIVRRDVDDLLADIRAAGKGNVRVVQVNPQGDPDAEEQARSLGIPPVQFNVIGESELQVKQGYIGLAVQYAEGTETIPIVQRTEDLEYRLVSYVRALTRNDRQVVGFVESFDTPPGGQGGAPGYQRFREELGRLYDVRTVSTSDSAPIDPEIDVLVLAGTPFMLDSLQRQRFGAYLGNGGSAMLLASGMVVEQQFMASARPVGWNQVLQPYGVSIRTDMIFDLGSNERVTMPVQGGRLMVSYPFWVRAISTRASVINQDLETVLVPWPSSIDTSGAAPGSVTPLLTTTEGGGREVGRAFIAPQRDFPRDSLGQRLLAVAVNPLAAESAEATSRGRVIVIGNSDVVSDRYTQSDVSGLVLGLNAVDWLAQEDALIAIRAKNRRPPQLMFESPTTRDVVKWGNVAGMPLLLILFASVRLFRRRQMARNTYGSEVS
jgi:ABC-2 type transport system permease protein